MKNLKLKVAAMVFSLAAIFAFTAQSTQAIDLPLCSVAGSSCPAGDDFECCIDDTTGIPVKARNL